MTDPSPAQEAATAADGQVRDLLTRAGSAWTEQQVQEALAIGRRWDRLADVVAMAVTFERLAAAGRTPDDCLFFLRVVPRVRVEELRTMLAAPAVFAAQTQVSGVHPDQVPWLWEVACGLGLPEDGQDAAGWVHAGILTIVPGVQRGRARARIEEQMRPWLDLLGPGAWRWWCEDRPVSLDEAVSLTGGWGQDAQMLGFVLGLGGGGWTGRHWCLLPRSVTRPSHDTFRCTRSVKRSGMVAAC